VTPSGQPTVRVANTTGMMPPIYKQVNFPNLKGTTDTTGLTSEQMKTQEYATQGHEQQYYHATELSGSKSANNKQVKINSAGVGSTAGKNYL